MTASVSVVGHDENEHDRAEYGSDHLADPVDDRERGIHAARYEEAEGHRRVEVTARDVADRGRHHRDHETVCERDRDEIASRRDCDGPRADERQRKGADELGDTAANRVVLHCLRA